MSQLPSAIQSFAQYKQFHLWALIQIPDRPKPAKVTVNAAGQKVDAHDPANMMTFDEAAALSAATGYGIGFVFTDDDPFWFLDVDACRNDDGSWNEMATTAMQWFPGAAVEVSQSGTGLHLFGCGTVPPGYKTRNQHLGIEFYTTKRFVALTMGEMSGDAWTDHSGALSQFVPAHLEPSTDVVSAEWTTEPRPEWNGPDDDDQLIEKMLASRSIKATFGDAASFRQLWEADAEALAKFYPDPEQGRAYDASSADAALFSMLAFWTGCNCERMDRIARRSALMRTKWDQHKSYVNRTAIGAVSRCIDVYSSGNQGGSLTEVGTGSHLLTVEQQYEYFANHVYVASLNQFRDSDGAFYKTESYDKSFGGKEFIYTPDGKTTKKPSEALTMNQCRNYANRDEPVVKVYDIWFRPELGENNIYEHNGKMMLNTYIEPKIETTNGDVSPFHDWFEKFLPVPEDREILLSYMAALVQKQGVKFFWCPVIQGVEGNGKSMLSTIIRYCIGGPAPSRYCHTVAAQNLDHGGLKFNAWIEGNIFIDFEEIYTRDKHSVMEALKPYITNTNIEVQGKGADQRAGYNCANMMMFSNHRDAVALSADARRYAIFYTAQQEARDIAAWGEGYMPRLYDWLLRGGGLAAMRGYLMGYPIRGEYDPSGACDRAPRTSSTVAAIEETRGVLEQDIVEAIEQGHKGFANGWISSIRFNQFLEERGLARKIGHHKRRDILRSLGYYPHPHLPKSRLTAGVFDEGGDRPVLYVHESLTEVGTEPRWVHQLYLQAQGYLDPALQ